MDYMTSPKALLIKDNLWNRYPNIGLTKLYLKGGILYKPAAITSASPCRGIESLEPHNNLQRTKAYTNINQ
jgi:hypothetical protein